MNVATPTGRSHRWLPFYALLFIFLCTGSSSPFPKIVVDFFDIVEPGCYGQKDGSVRAEASGGVEPYTYVWSNGTVGPVLSEASAGLYTVTVTDAEGNTKEKNYVLQQPLLLTVDFANKECQLPLKVTAVVSGGTGPYQYAWSTGATGATINAADGVEYCVTITDANACTTFGCVTAEFDPVSLSLSGTELSCAGAHDATLTATVSGGSAPYSYEWNTGEVTGTIIDLGPGLYDVTVTDAKGCTATASGEVLSKEPIVIELMETDPVCSGDNTGNIQTTVSGGNPPYTYLWNTGADSPALSDLTAGTYELTVTDADGCTATASAILSFQSELTIETTAGGESCPGSADGSAGVNAQNGVAPYTYIWSNGDTTDMLTGLTSGTYEVTVTDALGCRDTASVMVEAAPDFAIEVIGMDISSCGDADGMASVNILTGEGPFTYQWSTGDTTQTIDSLTANTYIVTVTNADACTAEAGVTIIEPTELEIEITGNELLCPGDSTASLAVAINGGIPPYMISWNTGADTTTITDLPPGLYSVTVTDSTGCSATDSLEVQEVAALTLTIGGVSVVCGAGNTGSAFADVSGGAAPYTYQWSTGDTTRFIGGLTTGIYAVTVTDILGCMAQDSVAVRVVDDLDVTIEGMDISCAGFTDGSATATASGGDEPYRYFWSNGATGPTIDQLTAGTYVVTVSDANNCTARDTIEISRPSPILAFLDIQDLVCDGDSTGSIDVTVSGGVPPYRFNWSTGDTTQNISGLPVGNYRVTITDAQDCFVVRSGNVDPPALFTLDFDIREVSCPGGADGAVTVTANEGTAPYAIEWFDGSNADEITGLSAGDYGVTLTDANGCAVSDIAKVTERPAMVCSITQTAAVVLPGTGALQATVEGGTAPYAYLWSNGETTATIDSLDGGTYLLTVTDVNGCTTNCTFELIALAALGDFVWDDDDEDGIQDANEAGLSGVLVYLKDASGIILDSTITSTTGQYEFIGLEPGNYSLQFTAPENYSFTKLKVGSNDNIDNDADPAMGGMTALINLIPGEFNRRLDAGLIKDCINVTDPGAIDGDQYLCGPGNDPVPFTSLAPATGGEGAIEYLWMYSTEGGAFDASTWTVIPNSNSLTYDPGILYETTYFARCARREECPGFLETNIVVVTVGDEVGAAINGPDKVCPGEVISFQVLGVENGTYQWDFGPGIQIVSESLGTIDIRFTSFGSFTLELVATEGNCTTTAFKKVLAIEDPSVCVGDLVIRADVLDPVSREVQIDWQMPPGSDFNYHIEFSESGQEFFELATLDQPESTSGEVWVYHHRLTAPKRGYNYFRVSLTDAQGITRFSNVEEIKFYNESPLTMLYPNPARELAVLEVFDSFQEAVRIEMISATGQSVARWNAEPEDKRLEMDLQAYPKGIYWLRVWFGDNQVKTLKLIKQ